MTRIIAGLVGGQRLAVPTSGTRPTAQRVREALFSLLEHRLDLTDCHVLDLFAGSGALGLEAASRGASAVVLVESARPAARVAASNARNLGLPARVVVGRAEAVVNWLLPEAPFDLVLIDPPYALPPSALDGLLGRLASSGKLADAAWLAVERSNGAPAPQWPVGWQVERSRVWGDTAVHLAQATSRLGE
ncbi:MAG: 16S rRNA (guanine(966)-N(2))-methyltransferase RsmD [Bifidobacteriaceae bacterium]|jgi:16S rRNA (guanine966-N2)-methyltransferase|nr:16S rRNA (guanine(966)-N(2))-methyltransferase RsmD [Bifidobacteriaceae bacterium]